MRAAGRIAREVLDAAGRAIDIGMTTDEIDEIVHDETIKRAAYPSRLNFGKFPKSCCTSVNEVLAHGIPDSYQLKDGDIVNVAVTCFYEGYHGSCSETFLVGNVDQDAKRLVKVTHDAWQRAIRYCKPGQPYAGIGAVIEDYVKAYGYSCSLRLCGHGIGKDLHIAPIIYHVRYPLQRSGTMQVGHAFTIQPIVCEGIDDYVTWNDTWTLASRDGLRSAQFEHTLLITPDGVEALTGRLPDSNIFHWEREPPYIDGLNMDTHQAIPAVDEYSPSNIAGTPDTAQLKTSAFCTFEEARKYARTLNLRSKEEWNLWYRSGRRPDGMPARPDKKYKSKGWISYSDFLGYVPFRVDTHKRSFEEARKYARTLNLSSMKEWHEWCKSEERPHDIPSCPDRVYKNIGWISSTDWLGSDRRPFEEARKYARTLNFSSLKEWQEWSKSVARPDDIPSNPAKVYKNDGWSGYEDWLGFERKGKGMRSFEEAREYARTLNLSSLKAWKEWCKSGARPADIPSNPSLAYEMCGWIGLEDWLGYSQGRMRSFEEARSFARTLNLRRMKDWQEWCKSGERPRDIPSCPWQAYGDKGWISLSDWLGYGEEPSNMIPFEEARSYARTLNLSSSKEWQEWCKSGARPDDIPCDPSKAYKRDGWSGFPDWLGFERNGKRKRSFEEAREYARTLNLNSSKEWREWCKSGERPDDIPSNPALVYKMDGWIGFADWLGYERSDKATLSFEEAREYARTLNLSSSIEWQDWSKSVARPDYIPSNPAQAYKNDGWIGFPDWLGYGKRGKGMRSFEEAREYARTLNFSSLKEWKEWCKSGARPDDIPADPTNFYKMHGWSGFPNWLGYEGRGKGKGMRSFEEARNYVGTLNLSSLKEWKEWSKSGVRPADIPSNPALVYEMDGWIGFADWLGNGDRRSAHVSAFEEARGYARTLNLSSSKEWHRWCKSGARPADIPSNPAKVYKNDGWSGFPDWLGFERRGKGMRSFEEARSYARTLNLSSLKEWQEWCKSGARPADIPSNPAPVYKDDGWSGFPDWLGFERKGKRKRSFEEAREYVRTLNLNSPKEWREWCKSGERPDDIPSNPAKIYESDGWIGLPDWLGYKRKSQGMRSFEEARSYARTLNLSSLKEWQDWSKSGARPVDIPSNPSKAYKNDGWSGLPDWLGF